MTRTPTLPLDDKRMWRTVLTRLHPDAGGSHEAFIFGQAVRDEVCGGTLRAAPEPTPRPRPYSSTAEESQRVPYDPALGYVDEFVALTWRALSIGKRAEEPHKSVLIHLIDREAVEHGRRAERQCRGATYKQLAAIGHRFGMSKAERCRWYEIARSIPLSEQHASHILSKPRGRSA